MIDEKRVNEAKSNVNVYLREGILKKVEIKDENILKILKKNCDESLSIAELIFNGNHSNLWTIVCSYYAMYYIANAVLYNFSYKVGDKVSHKVTADALIVYIMGKLKKSLLEDYEEAREEALILSGNKAEELIKSFDIEREKRSYFQYTTEETAMNGKAKTSLERAKRFVFEMRQMIEG